MKIAILFILAVCGVAHAQTNLTVIKNSRNVIVNNVTIKKVYPMDDCIDEDWVEIESAQAGKPTCRVSTPLSFEQTTRNYPRLGNESFTVRYWKAAVTKSLRFVTVYDRYITNVCLRRQLSRSRQNVFWSEKEMFPLQNPNLSENVSASYELSPMTEQEARDALSALTRTCGN